MRQIGFFSYKGGVGRTNLVTNMAYDLAVKRGMVVGLLDLDLEAPGLSVAPALSPLHSLPDRGLVDFLDGAVTILSGNQDKQKQPPLDIASLAFQTELGLGSGGAVLLFPAAGYEESEDGFRLKDMTGRGKKAGNVYHRLSPPARKASRGVNVPATIFSYITDRIKERKYTVQVSRSGQTEEREIDFLLVDLRTGLNELAAQATGRLFTELVLVSGLNTQNVAGLFSTLEFLDARLREEGLDAMEVLPVFSPVPNNEMELVGARLREIDARLRRLQSEYEQGGKLRLKLPFAGSHDKQAWPNLPVIHHCDYLALSDSEAILERFPATLTSREIADIVELIAPREALPTAEHLAKELQSVPQPPQTRRVRPELDWLRKILREPPPWDWALRPPFVDDARAGEEFRENFLSGLKPEEIADDVLRSLMIDPAVASEEVLRLLRGKERKLTSLSSNQVATLHDTFTESRTALSACVEDEWFSLGRQILKSMLAWLTTLRDGYDAPIANEHALLKRIFSARDDELPIGRDLLVAAFMQSDNNEIGQRAFSFLATCSEGNQFVTYCLMKEARLEWLTTNLDLKSRFKSLIRGFQSSNTPPASILEIADRLAGELKLIEEASNLVDGAKPKFLSTARNTYSLALCLSVRLGRYKEAEAAYRKAIEIDPRFPYPWNGLGNLLADHLSRYDEAEAAYRKAIELDPRFPHPWNGLGNLLAKHLSRYEEAEAAYRKAIELDPRYAYPWNGLGSLLADHLSRYEEAEAAYRKAIELDPKYSTPWYGLGILLTNHFGRYEEAEAAYRKAIELDPRYADPWNGLGNLLANHLNRYDEADAAYDRLSNLATGEDIFYGRFNQAFLWVVIRENFAFLNETRPAVLAWLEQSDILSSKDIPVFASLLLLAYGLNNLAREAHAQYCRTHPKEGDESDALLRLFLTTYFEERLFQPPSYEPERFGASEMEYLAGSFALLSPRLSPEQRQALTDWLADALTRFVPPPGSRDIAPSAINPALRALGMPSHGRA